MPKKSVTDATFTDEVLSASTPVLVDFWAEWCQPCRKVDITLDEIAVDFAGRVEFVKLNIDENPETTLNYGVMSLPTLTIFKDGEPVASMPGTKPRSELVRFIESAL
jgi:thioredoxin 1